MITNDLYSYITGKDINVHKLQCVSHDLAANKSFQLTIPLADYSKIFNSDIWPEGIKVRPFIHSRKAQNAKQTDTW